MRHLEAGKKEREYSRKGKPELAFGTVSDADGLSRWAALGESDSVKKEKFSRLAKNNDETELILASSYGRPGGLAGAVEQLVRHKDYSREEAKRAVAQAHETLAVISPSVDAGAAERAKKMELAKERIIEDIRKADEFFRPSPDAFGTIKKVVYLPDGKWRKPNGGFGVELNEEMLLAVDPENRVNVVHEYLHAHINNATERAGINAEDTRRLAELGKERLVRDYGADNLSLWNEALIRAYRDGFRPENAPNFDNWRRDLMLMGPDKLAEALRHEGLEDDAKTFIADENRQRKIFEELARDRLLESAWRLLRAYDGSRRADPTLRFEDYFRDHYREMLPPEEAPGK